MKKLITILGLSIGLSACNHINNEINTEFKTIKNECYYIESSTYKEKYPSFQKIQINNKILYKLGCNNINS